MYAGKIKDFERRRRKNEVERKRERRETYRKCKN